MSKRRLVTIVENPSVRPDDLMKLLRTLREDNLPLNRRTILQRLQVWTGREWCVDEVDAILSKPIYSRNDKSLPLALRQAQARKSGKTKVSKESHVTSSAKAWLDAGLDHPSEGSVPARAIAKPQTTDYSQGSSYARRDHHIHLRRDGVDTGHVHRREYPHVSDSILPDSIRVGQAGRETCSQVKEDEYSNGRELYEEIEVSEEELYELWSQEIRDLLNIGDADMDPAPPSSPPPPDPQLTRINASAQESQTSQKKQLMPPRLDVPPVVAPGNWSVLPTIRTQASSNQGNAHERNCESCANSHTENVPANQQYQVEQDDGQPQLAQDQQWWWTHGVSQTEPLEVPQSVSQSRGQWMPQQQVHNVDNMTEHASFMLQQQDQSAYQLMWAGLYLQQQEAQHEEFVQSPWEPLQYELQNKEMRGQQLRKNPEVQHESIPSQTYLGSQDQQMRSLESLRLALGRKNPEDASMPSQTFQAPQVQTMQIESSAFGRKSPGAQDQQMRSLENLNLALGRRNPEDASMPSQAFQAPQVQTMQIESSASGRRSPGSQDQQMRSLENLKLPLGRKNPEDASILARGRKNLEEASMPSQTFQAPQVQTMQIESSAFGGRSPGSQDQQMRSLESLNLALGRKNPEEASMPSQTFQAPQVQTMQIESSAFGRKSPGSQDQQMRSLESLKLTHGRKNPEDASMPSQTFQAPQVQMMQIESLAFGRNYPEGPHASIPSQTYQGSQEQQMRSSESLQLALGRRNPEDASMPSQTFQTPQVQTMQIESSASSRHPSRRSKRRMRQRQRMPIYMRSRAHRAELARALLEEAPAVSELP